MPSNIASVSNPIMNKFIDDKAATLSQVQSYLKDNTPSSLASVQDKRNAISNSQIQGDDFDKNIGNMIRNLEELRDLKLGITTQKFQPQAKDGINPTAVLVRDARNVEDTSNAKQSFLGTIISKLNDKEQKDPKLGTEAFEMQYLNVIRAARDIADIERKPDLKKQLEADAQNFMRDFHDKNKYLDQKGVRDAVNKEIAKTVQHLSDNGIENARDKVNIAKDFQNLKEEQANIVTLSLITTDKGTALTAIEAEVALRGLTEAQKTEYDNVRNNYQSNNSTAEFKGDPNKLPEWFKELQPFEKELCYRNIDAITDGKHVISTQLRQIVGMKNAFEKTTAVANEKGDYMEVLKESKHAGTIASFAKGADEGVRDKERARITQLNAGQAQEWIGDQKQLHCVTLNSAKVGTQTDVEIVESTVAAMNHVANDNSQTKAGRATNLAYNMLRMSSDANIYDGLRETIANIKDNINGLEVGKKLDAKAIDPMVKEGNMGVEAADIVKDTIKIEKMLEKTASVFARIGLDNFNADIEVAQTNLMDKIAKAKSGKSAPEQYKGLELAKITAEESLVMCASGKDRTGFAQHDGSARAFEELVNSPSNAEKRSKLGIEEGDSIDIKHIDKQLMGSRHTATMAGSIYAGGASVGAFGTKKDNIQSLIKERFKNLVNIIAVSASGNNLPSADKIEKLAREANLEQAAQNKEQPKVVNSFREQKPNQPLIGAHRGTQQVATQEIQSKQESQQPVIGTHSIKSTIETLKHPKPLPPIPEKTIAPTRPVPPVPNKPLPPIPEKTTATTKPVPPVPNKLLPSTSKSNNSIIEALKNPTPKPLPPIPKKTTASVEKTKRPVPKVRSGRS
ncbi:MAG: hypothetical protein EOP33_04760 [Rickettsiaceae bacterium]|nr:MAG: hypothetical protein EOP33_04760 [Rickettsiaceae bacterium]